MDDQPIFRGNVRPTHDAALEEDGLLGTVINLIYFSSIK